MNKFTIENPSVDQIAEEIMYFFFNNQQEKREEIIWKVKLLGILCILQSYITQAWWHVIQRYMQAEQTMNLKSCREKAAGQRWKRWN